MKRTGRVSYKTILKFQEYLIKECLNGDTRIGQAIYNYTTWSENIAKVDIHHMEEEDWEAHFEIYMDRHMDKGE